MQDRQVLLEFTLLIRSGDNDKTFSPLISRAPDQGQARKNFENFKRVDPRAHAAQAQIVEKASQVCVGAGAQEFQGAVGLE